MHSCTTGRAAVRPAHVPPALHHAGVQGCRAVPGEALLRSTVVFPLPSLAFQLCSESQCILVSLVIGCRQCLSASIILPDLLRLLSVIEFEYVLPQPLTLQFTQPLPGWRQAGFLSAAACPRAVGSRASGGRSASRAAGGCAVSGARPGRHAGASR